MQYSRNSKLLEAMYYQELDLEAECQKCIDIKRFPVKACSGEDY